SSVEYGLIVALIGGVLCVGIGVTVKSLFEHTIICLLAEFQGEAGDGSCSNGGGNAQDPPGPGDAGTPPSGGPSLSECPTASPPPSPSPSASPTTTPSPSPTDPPAAADSSAP